MKPTQLDIRTIPLGPNMTKFHFQQPGLSAMHWIDGQDIGDPHDHPFGFTSWVMFGGYVEEVFNLDGSSYFLEHKRDDSLASQGLPVSEAFYVPAKRIHRIVELLEGECITMTLPHAWEQEWGNWKFEGGKAFKRIWNQEEWVQQPTA